MTGVAWEVSKRVQAGMSPEESWLEVLLGVEGSSKRAASTERKCLEMASGWLSSHGLPAINLRTEDYGISLDHLVSQGMAEGSTPKAVICDVARDASIPSPFQRIFNVWPDSPVMKSDDLAVRGVAEIARRMSAGISSYFETLIPLYLFVKKLNRYGDPVPGWRAMIEHEEVEAGEFYETSNPIEGLTIPANESSILLCLRRSYRGDEQLRNVTASLQEVAEMKEPISVSAKIRPGQGFARVDIESVRKGVLRTVLNWRTMERCSEPPPITYGWPPGVAKVVEAPAASDEAKRAMFRYVRALDDGARRAGISLETVLGETRGALNSWMTREAYELRYGAAPILDPSDTADHNFVYFGPVSSHLDLSSSRIGTTLEAFGAALVRSQNNVAHDKIIQCASWLYRACPEELLNSVRREFEEGGAPGRPQLAFAGNVFSRKDDLRLFYRRFCREIRKPEKLSPNNWLRAYRNIARFRRYGVSPDVLSKTDQDTIVLFIYATLNSEFQAQNFKRKFDNCLYMLPHMLKRRRHDQGFLNLNDGLGPRIQEILVDVVDQAQGTGVWRPTRRQAGMAEGILKLLEFEATESTLQLVEGAEDG
jgi:hypothetical protein